MGLSLLLAKYVFVLSGFGSAAVVPLMYSSGLPLGIRGGQLSNTNFEDIPEEELKVEQRELRNTYLSSVSTSVRESSKNFDKTAQSRANRDTSSAKSDVVAQPIQLSIENQEVSERKPLLKVEHDLANEYQGVVSYEQFRDIWGTKGFKEEGDTSLRGGENITILDAWERFFKNNQLDRREVGESFFLRDGESSLPFWNYDFPYIAVELPKGIQLPKEIKRGTLNSGWMKVNAASLEQELKTGENSLRGLKEAAERFAKVSSSEGTEREKHVREKTINKIMQPSEDADLYLVSAPEKLLRLWLGDWTNLSKERIVGDSFSLFEHTHYEKTEDHPEMSILRRWWNGKSYRMWIHHKELKAEEINFNKKEFTVSDKSTSSTEDKTFKPALKWGKDFLLNLLTWYAYTYKLGGDSLSYSLTKESGGWNLQSIYKLNEGVNTEDFSRWIRDWYKGTGREEWVYWWNLAILRGRTFDRTERINWVGEMMDNLPNKNWGKPIETRVVS